MARLKGSPSRYPADAECAVPECSTAPHARGWCGTHYERWRQHGDPQAGRQRQVRRYKPGSSCTVTDCERAPTARGWCAAHYQRWAKRGGDPSESRRRQRGTGHLKVNGYVLLWAPGHPNARKSGHILEHVKVMAEVLARPLLPGETVHHLNGVRDDNRPENLELWLHYQPPGQRVADLVVWAREILDRYAGVREPATAG